MERFRPEAQFEDALLGAIDDLWSGADTIPDSEGIGLSRY